MSTTQPSYLLLRQSQPTTASTDGVLVSRASSRQQLRDLARLDRQNLIERHSYPHFEHIITAGDGRPIERLNREGASFVIPKPTAF